jgi:hypothetical protein
MGTSQSSGGPGAGVPMVPSWTPDPPADDAGPTPDQPPQQPVPPATPPAVPVAPSGRFGDARRSLGSYAHGGNRDDLRRSLGHYVRTGYGGARTATRRLGGTAATAAALGTALAALAGGGAGGAAPGLDPASLVGRSADDVLAAVVDAVRPIDGTLDAEASRASIRDALSELLTRFPEADLLNLSDIERTFAIERYAAADVFRRFQLDLGKTISDRAPSIGAALARLKEARDYIKEVVGASFRKLRDAGRTLTAGQIAIVVRDAVADTFQVFEGYAE